MTLNNSLQATRRIDISELLIEEALRTAQAPPPSSPPPKRKIVIPRPAALENNHDEARYAELFQNIYDAAIITNLSGTILDFNIRAYQFFNYTREEFRASNILELIANSDPDLLSFIHSSLSAQRHVLIQAFCIRKNKTTFPVEIAVNSLHIPDNQLCFFIRDITARHRAEQSLRESELKFRTIFDNTLDGVSVTQRTFGPGADCRLIDCNKAFLSMSGRTHKELHEANLWDYMNLIDPPDLDIIREGIENMQPFQGTYSWIRPDAAINYVDFKAIPLQLGNRTYVYSVDRDVTERKQAEAMRVKAEKQEAMIASLGAARHHLGQPATVLLTNLTLMENGQATPEELLTSTLEAAERIADILHKMNMVDEYKTIPYAYSCGDEPARNKILDL